MEGDANYFRRRANEERLAAMKAAHPAARTAHLTIAKCYADLAGPTAARQVGLLDKVS